MKLVPLDFEQKRRALKLKANAERRRKEWERQFKLAEKARTRFSRENERFLDFLGSIAQLEKREYYGVRTPKSVDLSPDGNNIEIRETE